MIGNFIVSGSVKGVDLKTGRPFSRIIIFCTDRFE